MNAKELEKAITYAITAHEEKALSHKKTIRKWDNKTPYGIHPVWCAMTLLTETSLPDELRQNGAIALLFHDILEDTTADLPEGTSKRVCQMVQDMTYKNSDEERRLIWQKPAEIKLFKLYDKTSNMMDGTWMPEEKRQVYYAYVEKLIADVEANFGSLNITRMAKGLTRKEGAL